MESSLFVSAHKLTCRQLLDSVERAEMNKRGDKLYVAWKCVCMYVCMYRTAVRYGRLFQHKYVTNMLHTLKTEQ